MNEGEIDNSKRKFLRDLGAAGAVALTAGVAANIPEAEAQSVKQRQEPRMREGRERENTTARFVAALAEEFAKLDKNITLDRLPPKSAETMLDAVQAYLMAFALGQGFPNKELPPSSVATDALVRAEREASRTKADIRLQQYLEDACDRAIGATVREQTGGRNPKIDFRPSPSPERKA